MTNNQANDRPRGYLYPLTIIAILFFVFGFLTWISGILIPYLQICLQLTNAQASLVSFASYIAYFVLALPAAAILRKTGYRNGMVVGLILMAIGAILFIPAAYSRTFGIFLTGLFITGGGVTLLQTAVNPYVAIIGPAESTAQRIGFMGFANKVAGIFCSVVLGSIFLLNADTVIDTVSTAAPAEQAAILDAYALKIVNPYLVITLVLIALAVLIFFSKLPEITETAEDSGDIQEPQQGILSRPYLVLGVVSLFVSTACEGLPIDGIIIYSRAQQVPIEEARHFIEYSLYAMLIGYVASILLIPRYMSQQTALLVCALMGLALTVGAYLNTGSVSVWCLVITALAGAMLWGIIWGLAIRNLGKHTKTGSALLLMAVVGGGLFPLAFGKLIDDHPLHPQTAVLILIPCYLFLLYYALKGHKIESWKPAVRKYQDSK